MDTPTDPRSDTHNDTSVRRTSSAVKLSALDSLSLDELLREWQRLYHHDAPKISRDFLIRGIGYRLQELQHGGVGKSTRRKLKTLAKMFRSEGRVAPDPGSA